MAKYFGAFGLEILEVLNYFLIFVEIWKVTNSNPPHEENSNDFMLCFGFGKKKNLPLK